MCKGHRDGLHALQGHRDDYSYLASEEQTSARMSASMLLIISEFRFLALSVAALSIQKAR